MFRFKFGGAPTPKIEKPPLQETSIDDVLALAHPRVDPILQAAVAHWQYIKENGGGLTPAGRDALRAIEAALSEYGIILQRPDAPANSQTASESWNDEDWWVYTLDVFASRYYQLLDDSDTSSEDQAAAA